ncbi:hypothetical protein [Amphiplicatus metriothermophilus]|uniref:Tetratricopeptide repeat-containing protein n=1 Tax=Amphiplicatus metriothermophilus TaxID=1519374 RepID=A0A239PKQ5_9PROT|nr:hypothetical protein [Amphiplicatus metriothermophilus]MBB5517262.1 tetratricopeptide (TPR) repeat protein [Amphiplicatus metriothermophilus]SNT68402.1 hypothetical protein SAMN06297382_0904 [Amphiplicatus metriothermophilus]
MDAFRAIACGVCFLVAATSGAVEAAPDDEAYALYRAGAYEAAAKRAVAAGGTDNLVLAARALNAAGYFDEDRKGARRLAGRALDHAEAALEADPDNVEAHLQAGISLALRGANMAPVRAFFLGLPGRARRHIDRALALDPDNPWAWSTSAAWRLETARRGGGSVYGADPEEGFREFMKARALEPDNIAIAYECALRLLASGRPEWRPAALEALAAAMEGRPQTAFDAGVQARARLLSEAVAVGPDAEAAFLDAQP